MMWADDVSVFLRFIVLDVEMMLLWWLVWVLRRRGKEKSGLYMFGILLFIGVIGSDGDIR